MTSPISVREKPIVLCIALMAFTFQFDAMLITIALPDMARELNVSISSISWVLLLYLIAATAVFVPAGKLADRLGLLTVSLAGCIVGAVGTLLCGLASNIEWLYLGRLIQGAGCGAMVATGYGMMPTWVSHTRTGWGYGVQSLGAGVGMMAGAPVGGLLSHYLAWQWLFLATLPLFILLTWFTWRVIPDASHQTLISNKPINWTLIGLFTLAMTGAVFILGFGATLGWLSTPISLAMVGITMTVLALWWFARRGQILFPGALFQSKSMVLAWVAMFVFAALVGGVRFTLPFYLEVACGFGILLTSALMLAYPMVYAPVSFVAGQLSDRWGSRRVILTAATLTAVTCLTYAPISPFHNVWLAGLFVLFFGMSTGLNFAPSNRLIMSTVPITIRGEAGGLLSVVFNFGTLVGVVLFEQSLEWHPTLAFHILNVNEERTVIVQTAIDQQFSQNFLLAVGLSVVIALLIFKTRDTTTVT
jgi:MFS family permease